jgi:hypothetical protein
VKGTATDLPGDVAHPVPELERTTHDRGPAREHHGGSRRPDRRSTLAPQDQVDDQEQRADLEERRHAESDPGDPPAPAHHPPDPGGETEHHELVALPDVDGVRERKRDEERADDEQRRRQPGSSRQYARGEQQPARHADRGWAGAP